MPIATINYKRPMPFVSGGLASWSSHSALLGMHRASPYPTALTPTTVNNLAVHRIMERMGYSAGHGLGLHHQGDANLIQVRLRHRYSGLSTDRADASYIIPAANNPSNDSTSSDDAGARNWSPDDDEVMQPPSPQKSHTEVALDTVISVFTNLLTQYPSNYREMSLADRARKISVCILQDMFNQLMWWDPLEQPNRRMEAVSKLKYILLDDESTSSPYVGLLIELVVSTFMKWLEETWTYNFPH